MPVAKVIIEIHGGIPTCVAQPDNVAVFVHDYDIGAYYPWTRKEYKAHIRRDAEGNRYWEKII